MRMRGAGGPNQTTEEGLVPATVRLGRALRERGIPSTPAEAVEAARALTTVDVGDRHEIKLALRSIFIGRVEDVETFDEIFDEVWTAGERARSPERDEPETKRVTARKAEPRSMHTAGQAPLTLEGWLGQGGDEAEPVGLPTVGTRESRASKDFSSYDAGDLEAVTRVAARIARRLAMRPSRRWKPVRRGPRVHARHTLRRSFRTGGDPVELVFRRRRPRKTNLVVLCDVSGSMDIYSRFLLQFIYAMQNCFARVESFVFSTRLSRVTDQLLGPSYGQALERLTEGIHGWSGGTRIGESLAAFDEGWPRLVDRRTIVLILSDGWDTGEPEVLGRVMRGLHRRAGKVIWLNPLLGNPEYRPLTRGMQAALPYIDVFAPAHNLAALSGLAAHLRL